MLCAQGMNMVHMLGLDNVLIIHNDKKCKARCLLTLIISSPHANAQSGSNLKTASKRNASVRYLRRLTATSFFSLVLTYRD